MLAEKVLVTDKKLYQNGETVNLYAFVISESCAKKCSKGRGDVKSTSDAEGQIRSFARVAADFGQREESCSCSQYHPVAILTPTKQDKAFPVVLREPVAKKRAAVISAFANALMQTDSELFAKIRRLVACGCIYYGSFVAGNVPIGPWKHYLYVQTVNTTPEGMDPCKRRR